MWLRNGLALSLVIAFLVATCTDFYYHVSLNNALKEFSVVATPSYGAHTTAYNVDSVLTDREYKLVRVILGTGRINERVTIIRVADKRDDGSIGDLEGAPVVGLYVNNVIVYDGDLLTLRHELAHFFYEKVRERDKSEVFAQLLEKVFYILPNGREVRQ